MRFLNRIVDGRETLCGLFSEGADPNDLVVVHIHGYGGDCYSHPFVQALHTALPVQGFSFLSCDLATSHYISEQYVDGSVSYIGSALVDPEVAYAEIVEVCTLLREDGRRVVLQGHSFGTNIVRRLVLDQPHLSVGAIYLAPADSEALQEGFEAAAPGSLSSSPPGLDANSFGIAVDDVRYEIPISSDTFSRLRLGRIFSVWSSVETSSIPTLIVQGVEDRISAVGNTGNRRFLSEVFSDLDMKRVPGGHSFAAAESELVGEVVTWLEELRTRHPI